MTSYRARLRAVVGLLSLALIPGCIGSELPGKAVVFPKAAREGDTAAIALDSNYILDADKWESYTLTRNRVEIFIDDEDTELKPAEVRGVFSLHVAPNSKEEYFRAGEWVTVALFNLPTGLTFSEYPAEDRRVVVKIDGEEEEDERREGSITVLWSDLEHPGSETVFDYDGVTPPLEERLEPFITLRLRAVRAVGGGDPALDDGFDDGWEIGGFEVEIVYRHACIYDVRGVYPTGDASRATAMEATPSDYHVPFGYTATRVLMLDPKGFTLQTPSHAYAGFEGFVDKTSAGQGPFLDVAFFRNYPQFPCAVSANDFKLRRLYVTDLDGQVLIDTRSDPDWDPDLSPYVRRHVVDPYPGS
jgi:hypothetical protein